MSSLDAPTYWRRCALDGRSRDTTGEYAIACAGRWEYIWDHWREELQRVAAENPGCSVACVCGLNGISFCGVVPPDWNGQSVRVVAQ